MKIDKLTLKNYRSYSEIEFTFNSKFNVLVGVNGSGKTTVLRAVCEVLSGLCNFIPMRGIPHEILADGTATADIVDIHGLFRHEETYPVEVTSTGEFQGAQISWGVKRESQLQSANFLGQTPGGVLFQGGSSTSLADKEKTFPLVAFYQADRNWSRGSADAIQASTKLNSRNDGYANWSNASLDADALQSWVIAKSFERLEASADEGSVDNQSVVDELALVNSAIAIAVEGAKGFRYSVRRKSLFLDWVSSEQNFKPPTAFRNLSDGQRVTVCLVADIARRMCLLNPHLGEDVLAATPGVILIDELDIHLHPKWQRLITIGLKSAFPKIQFIVASHSPQVISVLQPEEIVLLRSGGFSHPQASYGLDSAQVLEEIMGADARPPEVQDQLKELFRLIEGDELPLAKLSLASLRESAPGIAELVGAEALIRRKEILGR